MRKRPGFITFLAVMSLVSGIFIFGVQIYAISMHDQLPSNINMFLIGALIMTSLLGFLNVISGIGMLKGLKWGWWLGAFNQIFGVARNIIAFVYIYFEKETLSAPNVDIPKYLAKYGIRAILGTAIAVYFFSRVVAEYFDIDHSKRTTSALKIIGVSILMLIIREAGSMLL